MKTAIKNEKFDTMMEPSDWRYSAAIVGLIKYFNHLADREIEEKNNLYEIQDDVFFYNSKAVIEKNYLMFAENYFQELLHHGVIERLLKNDELTEKQIKFINNKLQANTAMKKVFGNIKFSEENKEIILQKINDNRYLLAKENFKTQESLYGNFASASKFASEPDKICRLQNYTIDWDRKSKSISYNWDNKTLNSEDIKEFDFIPFAFSKSNESFFINNNYSIEQLFNANRTIENSENPRKTLFCDLKNSASYIDYDVEVIKKVRGKKYFETLYIRKETSDIIKKITNYSDICIKYYLSEKRYINYEEKVIEYILNNRKLDNLIDLLLKSKDCHKKYSKNIETLIYINTLIYGGYEMDKSMKSAYASAKEVVAKFKTRGIKENKIDSYRQKLISALAFKDYERFCSILLQLSSYSDVVFNFAYDLFEDFDGNKNLAYTFINALNSNDKFSKENGGKNNE